MAKEWKKIKLLKPIKLLINMSFESVSLTNNCNLVTSKSINCKNRTKYAQSRQKNGENISNRLKITSSSY